VKLTAEQQKFFDDHVIKQRQVHAEVKPKVGEVWLGNASWSKDKKAEIIDFLPEDGTWERGKVTWKTSEETFHVTGLQTFKTMYASPEEWALHDKLSETMEVWRKTSN
jgi:hypothetical protein